MPRGTVLTQTPTILRGSCWEGPSSNSTSEPVVSSVSRDSLPARRNRVLPEDNELQLMWC